MVIKTNIPESQVVTAWLKLLDNTEEFVTEDGKVLKVLYPGRINDGRGGDFIDAAISLDGEFLRGAIEIHVKSDGWMNHRHHLDPAYNKVILHVVMWHNNEPATRLQNGNTVSVLALHKYADGPSINKGVEIVRRRTGLPCFQDVWRIEQSTLSEFLDKAGDERFYIKAAVFQREIDRTGAGQALYRGLMGALGYSKNKEPFLRLADRLPLQKLEPAGASRLPAADYLLERQAQLLGAAGFLCSRNREKLLGSSLTLDTIKELCKRWEVLHMTSAMNETDWSFYKVRPANSPVRRLLGMSHLLLRHRRTGLLAGLEKLLAEPVKVGSSRVIEDYITVPAPVLAENLSGGIIPGLPLIGRGRAADMAVNVCLPFSYAMSQSGGTIVSGDKILGLYHFYPRMAENSVEKHMASQLSLTRDFLFSARRQQGLIHIYSSLCTNGGCQNCRLGQPESGENIQIESIHFPCPEAEIAAGANHGGVVSAKF